MALNQLAKETALEESAVSGLKSNTSITAGLTTIAKDCKDNKTPKTKADKRNIISSLI